MAGRPPWLHAQGRLDAVVALTDLPAETASALLPPGLELQPQSVTAPGRHPLILLLGEHSRVGPARLRFGLRYRELVIALPCLRLRAGPPGPLCHLPLLLLDRRLPIWLGRRLYGFPKRRALIERSADRFDVARPTDRTPLLSARWQATGADVDPGPVRGLFEQPLITGRAGGSWRCAQFDFGFEQARLGALEAEVVVYPALLAGLPAGAIRLARAFRIETAWTLSRGSRRDPRTGRS